ncbi:MAG TPA: hypothetical protein PLZ98_06700, partial [Chitinophagaceae bacterium]|nr:hypothetical protein [Chitinophagaceae bacterium]
MTKYYFLLLFIACTFSIKAQTDPLLQVEVLTDTIQKRHMIPSGRMQILNMIDRQLQKADAADGVYDKLIDRDADIDKTALLSNAIFSKTTKTIAYIENNETDDMLKRKYLGRIIENLKLFNTDINDGMVDERFY